jgi:hypothetical protein
MLHQLDAQSVDRAIVSVLRENEIELFQRLLKHKLHYMDNPRRRARQSRFLMHNPSPVLL